MALSIEAQALGLICFALLGLMLGLLYDILRPMRYAGKRAWVFDALFCFAAGAVCFVPAASQGCMGLWDMAAGCAGFCLYINLLSPLILPGFLGISKKLSKTFHICIDKEKIIINRLKKFFTN